MKCAESIYGGRFPARDIDVHDCTMKVLLLIVAALLVVPAIFAAVDKNSVEQDTVDQDTVEQKQVRGYLQYNFSAGGSTGDETCFDSLESVTFSSIVHNC